MCSRTTSTGNKGHSCNGLERRVKARVDDFESVAEACLVVGGGVVVVVRGPTDVSLTIDLSDSSGRARKKPWLGELTVVMGKKE